MKINSAVLDYAGQSLTINVESREDVSEAFQVLTQAEVAPTVPAPYAESRNVTVEDIVGVIQALYRANEKIRAIKLYRLVTGAFLRDAKEACDRFSTAPDRL
jgi:ribosomal protein L7/L12